MSNQAVSVLICDDSALMRNLLGRIIEGADGLELAGKAMNGRFLLDKIPTLKPDVILLDLEMPEMNGIEFLKERKRLGIDIPVVILSSIARRGAKVTMEALNLGASDFILKPSGSVSEDIHDIRDHIVETLLAYGRKYKYKSSGGSVFSISSSDLPGMRGSTSAPPKKETSPSLQKERTSAAEKKAPPKTGKVEIVALGISTGGPNALRQVLVDIAPDLPVPMLIVQHMPAGFTAEFAKSLNKICPLEVKEGEDGDILSPGRIFIAPGGYHIEVEKKRLASVLRVTSRDLKNGHRPSAGVLFNSVAENFGGNVLAVIMTGMGKDGSLEIGEIWKKGGITIGQDQATSVVYGMPKVAAENGFIDHVVPLDEMASTINRLVKENFKG